MINSFVMKGNDWRITGLCDHFTEVRRLDWLEVVPVSTDLSMLIGPGTVDCLDVYHSFCRINQMQKPLYLIDIAKLDRYREKALGRYEGVPQKYFVSMKQENIYRHPAFRHFYLFQNLKLD